MGQGQYTSTTKGPLVLAAASVVCSWTLRLTDGSVVLVLMNVFADVVGFAVQLGLVFCGQVTTVLGHVVLFVPHQLIFLLL